MRRLLSAILCIGVTFLLLINPAYASDVKVGVIDTQKIMTASSAAKSARTLFLKDVASKREVLAGKQAELKAMDDELKNNGKDMTPAVRKEKSDKLAKGVKEVKRLRDDQEEELKQKERELNRKLLMEISEIVKEYTKKEGYSIVLEKRSLIAFDEAIDITDKIIRLYDVVR